MPPARFVCDALKAFQSVELNKFIGGPARALRLSLEFEIAAAGDSIVTRASQNNFQCVANGALGAM